MTGELLRSWIGSVLFSVSYISSTVVFGLLAPPIAICLPGIHRQKVLNVHNAILLFLFRIFCGVKIDVKGRENLVKGKTYVIVANHQSEWETYFIQVLVTPLSTVLKKELLSVPFFGWGLRMVQPIAIDRQQKTNALKQIMKQGKERLLGGRSVVIFPEGTRVAEGEKKQFNKGAAMLATSANKPILPIVHNAGRVWPGKKWLKKPGVIQVVIGEPIEVGEKNTNEVHDEMEVWMRNEMKKVAQCV
ncbi:1-acyl-sn-glycerol-3-phosphate acyltransferase [Marinomonas agarivorans]|nr:1-acyl-sn-glycerol-3-phosphate acyltransferase [Marinomonas agarivorans]